MFHGLLTGRSWSQLQYEQCIQDAPDVSLNCPPLDDSCAPPLRYDPLHGVLSVSDVVMSLRYTVIVTDNPEREGLLRKIVQDVFELIHAVANGWSEESEISKLNNVKPEKPMEISDTLSIIFDIVDELYEINSGRFDPTCGVVKLAYAETLREAGRPPLPTEINRYRCAMDWRKRISRKGNTVTKGNSNTIIDLNGVSKGFCVGCMSHALHLSGYNDFYVDWAGEVKAVGCHPSGRPWRTAIMKPPDLPRLFSHWKRRTLDQMLNESDMCALVNLVQCNSNSLVRGTGMSLARSVDYFLIQKYGYYHIFETHNIRPMKASMRSTGSVSVLASTCALADGLATAAMTYSTPLEAVQFLDSVQIRFPERVYGFCVLGRNSIEFRSPQRGLFVPVPSPFIPRRTMVYPSFLPDSERTKPFSLCLTRILALKKIALVVARIEAIHIGNARTRAVEMNGRRTIVELRCSTLRDDFSLRTIVDQAKECFAELPSSVSVMVATAADGGSYGLTATSLVISDHAPDVFCFNVMHSSIFFATFSGCGSRVTVYSLAAGCENLADTFASNSLVEPEVESCMKELSICCLVGTAKHVEMVDDHAVVLVDLKSCYVRSPKVSPLIWHRYEAIPGLFGYSN